MPIEITPTGEIVTMECLLRTPGVCLNPNGVGPVLLYKDEKERLWNVCKACAENAFSIGDWHRKGDKRTTERVITEYELLRDHYLKFGEVVTGLLQHLLSNNGIRHSSIEYRLKSPESLQDKLTRKTAVTTLADIVDLVGIRVITPFVDDVDAIGKIIEQEFEILSKSSALDYKQEDQFGYISRHYLIKLLPERRNLAEYKLVSNLQAELQVRSILQHAWTVLAHELQYKGEGEIPSSIRRQVYRVAALLEVSDQEFVKLRKAIEEYREAVTSYTEKKDSL
jgi:putative GTP pyrophosphokinase